METDRPSQNNPAREYRRDEDSGEEHYLLCGTRDQALVQPLGLLLREALGLVVPHQSPLDLDMRGIK